MFDYLQAGIVVKDRAGIRKMITRVDTDRVYWVYADRRNKRRHTVDYDRFIDTHFVVAEPKIAEGGGSIGRVQAPSTRWPIGVICFRRAMTYMPGEHVCITGAYEVLHLGHRPPHQVWLCVDEKFPRCRQCDGNVLFRFVRRASEATCDHISTDQDFLGLIADA